MSRNLLIILIIMHAPFVVVPIVAAKRLDDRPKQRSVLRSPAERAPARLFARRAPFHMGCGAAP